MRTSTTTNFSILLLWTLACATQVLSDTTTPGSTAPVAQLTSPNGEVLANTPAPQDQPDATQSLPLDDKQSTGADVGKDQFIPPFDSSCISGVNCHNNQQPGPLLPRPTCIAGVNCNNIQQPGPLLPRPTCIAGVNCNNVQQPGPLLPRPTCITGVNCLGVQQAGPSSPGPTCVAGVNCPEVPSHHHPVPHPPPPPEPVPPPPFCPRNIEIVSPDKIESHSEFDVSWVVPRPLAHRDFKYIVELWIIAHPHDRFVSTLCEAVNDEDFTDDGIHYTLEAKVDLGQRFTMGAGLLRYS
ncbi:hypothetical protein BDF22DRAFT_654626 [Syncephalis plumigaleata]|nr:hypothetical protein BDF22DRAFT_654626 [Syncephalis plumigaleata]